MSTLSVGEFTLVLLAMIVSFLNGLLQGYVWWGKKGKGEINE